MLALRCLSDQTAGGNGEAVWSSGQRSRPQIEAWAFVKDGLTALIKVVSVQSLSRARAGCACCSPQPMWNSVSSAGSPLKRGAASLARAHERV